MSKKHNPPHQEVKEKGLGHRYRWSISRDECPMCSGRLESALTEKGKQENRDDNHDRSIGGSEGANPREEKRTAYGNQHVPRELSKKLF